MPDDAASDVRLPKQLIGAVARRECVFFLGSGISVDAGLPSSADLARALAKELDSPGGYGGQATDDLLEMAQRVEEALGCGRASLIRVLHEQITAALPSANLEPYQLLASLAPQPVDIITTNWDKCTEETYGRDNINVILSETMLSQHRMARPNLVKLHGDLDDFSAATITRRDYAQYSTRHAAFSELVRDRLRQGMVLFIGYSAQDWDFLQNYLAVQEDQGESQHQRFAVTPAADVRETQHLAKLRIHPIPLPIRPFLQALAGELMGSPERASGVFENHPKFPDPRREEVAARNPFVAFRAEDTTDELWQRQLFREPKMYNIMTDALAPGNVLIEGHRGSGKTMILLYLSYRVQRLLERTPPFVGAYVKLDLPLFRPTRRRGEDNDEWLSYFLSYLNLIIVEALTKLLAESVKQEWVSPKDVGQLVTKLSDVIGPLAGSNHRDLFDLSDHIEELRSTYATPPPRPTNALPGDLVTLYVQRMRRFVPDWEDVPFYVLLDEFEHLSDDQQKVANILLTSRGPTYKEGVYYKVASKSFMTDTEDIDGGLLETPSDFVRVELDRFDLDVERREKHYQTFIEEIANWRLKEIWKYGVGIRDLLPAETDASRRGPEHGDYSGFENVAALSSNLPRDFLELCKDMLFYSQPDLLVGDKSSSLQPILPSFQNTVIRIHGDNLLESLSKITDMDDRPLPRTRSENARRLIESCGRVFRRILEGSRSKEVRTVSEFQLRGTSGLEVGAKLALTDCVVRRALLVPLTRRRPQILKNIPADRYELHRLLCARFGLHLARKWPKELDAEWINRIISTPNPKAVIDTLTRYFIERGEFPSQMSLFESKTEDGSL